MSTVIDALVVELGIDASKMSKGAKEGVDALRKFENDAKKHGGGAEKAAKGIEQAFSAVQSRLLAIGALFLGGAGIEQFTQRMMKLQTTTANVARTFGLSSQMMQQWAAAGERAGVSGGAVAQGLQTIQQQRYNLQNFGDPSGLITISRGWRDTKNPLNVQAPNGAMLPADQIAMNIAKWLQKAGPQGANALMREGGLSQDFIALLMKGPDKLKKLLEESRKFAPSDKEIGQWRDLNDAFEHTSQAATALAREITEGFIPSLIALLNTLTYWVQYWRGDPNAKKQADQQYQELHHELGKKFGAPPDIFSGKPHDTHAEATKKFGSAPSWLRNLFGLKDDKALQDNTEELKKLNEGMKGGVQNQSFIGGFGAAGDNGRVIQASFSGGGIGGFGWGGGGIGQPMGTGTTVRPGGPGINLDNLPGASDAALAGSRQGYADELRRKPWLAEKIMAISLGENRDPRANQAVIESMMNRAAVRGTSLEEAAKLYGKERGGYYAGYAPGALRTARLRALAEHSLKAALAGGNVSDYATDNSSGALAARDVASGHFQDMTVFNGEHFSRRMSEAGKYARWRRGLSALGTAGIPLPRPRPNMDLHSLERAGLDRSAGGGSHYSSEDMHIENMHLYPQKIDGDLASTIKPMVRRFASVASVNGGPT